MKKMKLLIGYDGSLCADAALEDLKKAGLPRHAEVRIVSAADVFLPPRRDVRVPKVAQIPLQHARASARKQMEQATFMVERARQKIKTLFPRWTVRGESCADSPAWAILKKAKTWKADLIVVGAHGHSRWGRFVGSVSQMVLAQAESSVRIGRLSARGKDTPSRILIALDGSPDSTAAVRAAMSRSWASGTEFLLVSVIDPQKSTFVEHLVPSDIREYLEAADQRHALVRMLHSHAKKFRDRGARVTCVVRKGDPKRVLVKEADAWRADCIFVGARGLSHLKRLFMGGVSIAIATRASCSVEVVNGGLRRDTRVGR